MMARNAAWNAYPPIHFAGTDGIGNLSDLVTALESGLVAGRRVNTPPRSGGAGWAESRNRHLSFVLLVATVLGVCLPMTILGAERSRPVKARGAAWSVDLRGQGYRLNPVDGDGGESDTGLAFGSDTELVVVDHARIHPQSGPPENQTHAFVIDARSGAIDRTRSWRDKYDSKVFGTAAGGYAVLDHGTVLYGPGLVEEVARSPHWVDLVSPTGGRFAAPTHPIKATVWITLDAKTLTEAGVIPGFYDNRTSLSDRFVACRVLRRERQPFIEISSEGRPSVEYPCPRGDCAPRLVSENLIVVYSEDRFDVISTDGTLRFSGSGGWDDGLHIATARDGRRMAVTRERYSGHWSLMKSEHVTVYDLEAGVPIWTVEHKAMKGAFSGKSGVALSPHGARLAIISRGVVTMHELPAVTAD